MSDDSETQTPHPLKGIVCWKKGHDWEETPLYGLGDECVRCGILEDSMGIDATEKAFFAGLLVGWLSTVSVGVLLFI